MRADELPKLSELEVMLLTVKEVYSETEPLVRPKLSDGACVLFNQLYAKSKMHGLSASDLVALKYLKEHIDLTYGDLEKVRDMNDKLNQVTNSANLRVLGVDESKGYGDVVHQIVEKYADCIIDAYQTAGHLDDLFDVLKRIKEVHISEEYLERRKERSNFMKGFKKCSEGSYYIAHNFFERVKISPEEIEKYAPLTECGVLVHVFNTSEDMQPYLVVPGTCGFGYHNDGTKTGMFRAVAENDNLNLAMQIVNTLYLKIKESKQAKKK